MRHLLNFLRFGKRDKTTTAHADKKRSDKADPDSTLVIAGEAIPRAKPTPDSGHRRAAEAGPREVPPRLAEVVKSRRKDRWHPPELEGPEFGGLIERRGVDTRGLMPEKYEPQAVAEHRQHQSMSASGTPQAKESGEASDGDGLESTGMFLASLDNSAITLADSGLFKIADEPEEAPDEEESFDPYDHRG